MTVVLPKISRVVTLGCDACETVPRFRVEFDDDMSLIVQRAHGINRLCAYRLVDNRNEDRSPRSFVRLKYQMKALRAVLQACGGVAARPIRKDVLGDMCVDLSAQLPNKLPGCVRCATLLGNAP